MKIICDRTSLVEAVLNVQRAVSTKSCLTALEGILIKTQENKIEMCGYDLEIGITTTVPAKILEPGEIIIGAKIFSDIIRRLPGGDIEITADDKLVTTIKSETSVFSLAGLPASDYPELPSVEDRATFCISTTTLKSMIKQTIFAVSDSDSKPINTGTLFEISNGNINLVSVDGYRLAKRTEKIDMREECKFVVPGKTLNEILKLIPEDDEPVTVIVGRRHITFKVGNYNIISRLLEGEFLDYTAAIPTEHSTNIIANTRNLIDSIERVSLVITDRLKSPIHCIFANNSVKISCITNIGRANDETDLMMEGDNLEIGFNNRYLLDALRNADTDEVRLQMNGPLGPLKVLPKEGEAFIFLVLPVRLKAGD